MRIVSRNLEETEKFAEIFVTEKVVQKNDRALLICLYGDLGSGKTTFTKALARVLGVGEFVTSPTFVIEKIYRLDGRFGFKKLVHIDAYRLESGKELLDLGLGGIAGNPDNIVVLEWPEKVEDVIPQDAVRVNFKFISENEREIVFE